MNDMLYEFESEVRRDANGAVDVEYYIAEAKRQRAKLISELPRMLFCRLKRVFRNGCDSHMREAFGR
ncbi:MAG: hypothetical protein AB2813_03645 [Candidatus Sedimenticola endophacoides]